MRKFILIVITAILAASLVCGENTSEPNESVAKNAVKIDENVNTVKTKRGITYLPPYPSYSRYNPSPYSRFPGFYRNPYNPFAPTYALTPGNAVVHSYSASYPKVYVSKPVYRPAIPPPILVHKPLFSQSVPSIPVYANRYPVFVPKPAVISKPIVPVSTVPQYTVSNFVPTNSLPVGVPASPSVPITFPQQPSNTLISPNGWRPVYTSVPSVQAAPINPPTASILPPFSSSNLVASNIPQRPSNFYLPVGQSTLRDAGTRSSQDGLTHSNGRFTSRKQ